MLLLRQQMMMILILAGVIYIMLRIPSIREYTTSIRTSGRLMSSRGIDNNNHNQLDHISSLTSSSDTGLKLTDHPDWPLLAGLGLTSAEEANWDLPQIKIQILTQNRLYSLKRLCDSLLNAKYLGSRVDLVFHVEADADLDTVEYVNNFEWPFGDLRIHQRVIIGGLMAAVVESWYPLSDNEYAIFLEDDIEVSPLFFIWSKVALLRYRYSNSPATDATFGISLYTSRVQELTWPRQELHFDQILKRYSTNSPFLWQLPCSWGALYYPEKWKEFTHYLRARLLNFRYKMSLPRNVSQAFPDFPSANYEVFVPNSRSNVWKNSWKKYFLEFICLRGYVMIYPNYPNETSFSTNHLEPGTHISINSKVRKKIDLFRVPLMKLENLKYLESTKFPHFNKLAVLNPFGVQTSLGSINKFKFQVVIHPKKSSPGKK